MNILTPETVSLVVTGLIVPTALYGIRLGVKFLENKISNQNFNKYMGIAEKSVETAVTSVSQTVVDNLKNSGSFDQTSKEEVFAQAKEIALSIMGQAAKDVVTQAHGDFNTWIDNQIEKNVKLLKQ